MRGVNKVILMGNLGTDPDILYLEGNVPVSKFRLATTENFKDKNGKPLSQTEWHNVVAWRGLAELSHNFLHKGSSVYIEGRIKTRHWEDKEHRRNTITEIIADNLIILDKHSDVPNIDEAQDLIFQKESSE